VLGYSMRWQHCAVGSLRGSSRSLATLRRLAAFASTLRGRFEQRHALLSLAVELDAADPVVDHQAGAACGVSTRLRLCWLCHDRTVVLNGRSSAASIDPDDGLTASALSTTANQLRVEHVAISPAVLSRHGLAMPSWTSTDLCP